MPEPIAEVRAAQGYDGLHQALRARADALGVPREQLDELAGLTRGHAGKLLAPYPGRAMGRTTLGPMMYALKVKLLVVPDDEIQWHLEPNQRSEAYAKNACMKPLRAGNGNMREVRMLQRQLKRDIAKRNGKKGGRKSGEARRANGVKIPRSKRRAIARYAACKRWENERASRLATRCAPGQTPENATAQKNCQPTAREPRKPSAATVE